MKLLIISHTPHYMNGTQLKGWGATVREIDYLAELFDEIIHIAPLYAGKPPESALAYDSQKVSFVPVTPAGGSAFASKLGILRELPRYLSVILRYSSQADVVHVRCPANISLLAIIALAFIRNPSKRWIKYAGNWHPSGKESFSYTFQRWWLRQNFARSKVTVNGEWSDQPSHIHNFLNPCLTDEELQEGMRAAEHKSIGDAMQLVFVGRLETAKGVARILEIVKELHQTGLSVKIDLIGDGAERSKFEAWCHTHQLEQIVNFRGWLARSQLNEFYANAHIMLFPSNSEGWPKVLSEAMAFGVVPVASDVSGIPATLRHFGTGKTFQADDLSAFVKAIQWYADHQEAWKRESWNSVQAAYLFSYNEYLEAVRKLLEIS